MIEYEFYSNKDGVNLLKNRRDLLCEATLKAICQHFNVTYKAPNAQQPVQKPVTNNPQPAKKELKNGTYNVNAKVTANSLNVRKGRPGTAGYNTILGQLKKGQVVKVGYCLNGWFGITINGKQGFISGEYVDF